MLWLTVSWFRNLMTVWWPVMATSQATTTADTPELCLSPEVGDCNNKLTTLSLAVVHWNQTWGTVCWEVYGTTPLLGLSVLIFVFSISRDIGWAVSDSTKGPEFRSRCKRLIIQTTFKNSPELRKVAWWWIYGWGDCTAFPLQWHHITAWRRNSGGPC